MGQDAFAAALQAPQTAIGQSELSHHASGRKGCVSEHHAGGQARNELEDRRHGLDAEPLGTNSQRLRVLAGGRRGTGTIPSHRSQPI
jgi:hypothetical protein